MHAQGRDEDVAQAAVAAQARLHHQWFLGLQLMVSMRCGAEAVGEWSYRLFSRQHHEKFLSSFGKLGLEGLPNAVACARYHVLSNGVGGVRVEYMEESDRKAWVRFRYPRWFYDGPAICGIPPEAGRGFLRGWYARNGESLGDPRLGFVCVSEDVTGQFGLCGYFLEHDHDLAPEARLRFAPGERPPPYDPAAQPEPPAAQWSAERLARAGRNYALDYCRNGLAELAGVIGRERAREIGRASARLTGLQQYPALAEALGAVDGGPAEAARFLRDAFAGMGDAVEIAPASGGSGDGSGDWGGGVELRQSGLRILRGLEGAARADLLACWIELWRGAVASHRAFMSLDAEEDEADEGADGAALVWRLAPA